MGTVPIFTQEVTNVNTRSKYKTKQRGLIIDCLKSAPDGHVTAGDIVSYFRSRGDSVGQSTIYRQLESMVDEGIVSKQIIDKNSPACFEYIGSESHVHSESCFHCKCEKCGKLIHMHCDELEEMEKHILKDHAFKIDPRRTVFYGICENCK